MSDGPAPRMRGDGPNEWRSNARASSSPSRPRPRGCSVLGLAAVPVLLPETRAADRWPSDCLQPGLTDVECVGRSPGGGLLRAQILTLCHYSDPRTGSYDMLSASP